MSEEDSCAVCDDPRSDEKNQIIYCDGTDCNLPLHQGCYDIRRIPEGDWYCDRCNLARFKKRVNVICCPSQVGPLKRIGNTNEFMHVVCAKFNKNVDCTMEPYIWKRSTQDTETCYICKKKFGLCIQCDNFDCTRYFHVTCGINSGLVSLGRPLPVSKPHFCNDHNPSLRLLPSGSSPSASSPHNNNSRSSTPTSSVNIPAKRPYKSKQVIRQMAHLNSDADSDGDDLPLSTSYSSKTIKKPKASGAVGRSQQQQQQQLQQQPTRLTMAHSNSVGSSPILKNTIQSGGATSRVGSAAPASFSSSHNHPPITKPLQRQQQASSSSSSSIMHAPPLSSTNLAASPASSYTTSPPTTTIPMISSTAPDSQQAEEGLKRDIKSLKQKIESEKKKNQQLAQEAKRTGELQSRVEGMTSQLERLNRELEEYRELKHKVTDIFMELNIGTTNGTYPTRDGIKHYIDILHETIRRTRMPTNEEWSEITTFATNLANSKSTNNNSGSGISWSQ